MIILAADRGTTVRITFGSLLLLMAIVQHLANAFWTDSMSDKQSAFGVAGCFIVWSCLWWWLAVPPMILPNILHCTSAIAVGYRSLCLISNLLTMVRKPLFWRCFRSSLRPLWWTISRQGLTDGCTSRVMITWKLLKPIWKKMIRVTLMNVRGGYTDKDRDMLMVISKS